MCSCVRVRSCTRTHARARAHTHTHTRTHTHTHTHTHAHTCMYTRIHTFTHMRIDLHTYTKSNAQGHIHEHSLVHTWTIFQKGGRVFSHVHYRYPPTSSSCYCISLEHLRHSNFQRLQAERRMPFVPWQKPVLYTCLPILEHPGHQTARFLIVTQVVAME